MVTHRVDILSKRGGEMWSNNIIALFILQQRQSGLISTPDNHFKVLKLSNLFLDFLMCYL